MPAHHRRGEDVVRVCAGDVDLIAGHHVGRAHAASRRVGRVRQIDRHGAASAVDGHAVVGAVDARHAAGQVADLARRAAAAPALLHALQDVDRARANLAAALHRAAFRIDADAVALLEVGDAVGVAFVADRRRRSGAHGHERAVVGLDHDASLGRVDRADDALDAPEPLRRGGRRGRRGRRRGDVAGIARLADTRLRRLDRASEQRDRVGADVADAAADAAHFHAVRRAQIREAGAADEDLRRAVDRAAEAVPARRERVGVDEDRAVFVVVGRDDEAVGRLDVRDRADDAADDAFTHVRARLPLATVLRERGQGNEQC